MPRTLAGGTVTTPDRNHRRYRLTLLVAVAILTQAGQGRSSAALAFHDSGAAACASCHVMHEATPGQIVMNGPDPLLTAATASDVCLVCHAGVDGVLADTPLQPGPERGAGNFVFLLEDNINDANGGQASPLDGSHAGHNIISPAYGLTADPRRSHGPGGNFPSSQLGCTSCHDPHGNENFRMLYGAGEIQGGSAVFTEPAPLAIGLDITDALQVESPALHTAYISGMSNWCANCHGNYHDNSGNSDFEHEFQERLGSDETTQYNRYEGSASPTSGIAATAYIPQVPFETPGATTTSTSGPAGGATVMCLTCHRAHASSAPAAGRWDFRVNDLNRDGQVSGSYALPSPYLGGVQGGLCEKCHAESPSSPFPHMN